MSRATCLAVAALNGEPRGGGKSRSKHEERFGTWKQNRERADSASLRSASRDKSEAGQSVITEITGRRGYRLGTLPSQHPMGIHTHHGQMQVRENRIPSSTPSQQTARQEPPTIATQRGGGFRPCCRVETRHVARYRVLQNLRATQGKQTGKQERNASDDKASEHLRKNGTERNAAENIPAPSAEALRTRRLKTIDNHR